MSDVSESLRAEVVLRAGNRCESCRLSQLGQEAAFHIDHVIPRADHFRWDGERIVALTAMGRATEAALALNRPLILSIRHEESVRGRHPPT